MRHRGVCSAVCLSERRGSSLYRSFVGPSQAAALRQGSLSHASLPSTGRPVTPGPQVEQLAHLLIATDETAAWALARELSGRAGAFAASCVAVVEPAARSLGDLWYRDDCSSVELDLGLFRLEAIVHELAGRAVAPALSNRAVLIAPQPGEPHLLGATLDAEVLCHAGWATRAEFPGTDEALQSLVADEWFDVVDLSLSTALRREGSLARLARTITGTRRASCNPALVVVVRGRVFAERHEVCAGVGADVNASEGVTLAATIEAVLCRPRSTQPRRERPSSGRAPRSRAIRS
jgi:MerR family transcriptional regulator, light-induced transcriptional regulator